MTTIGFVGTGGMGSPMASHLLAAGYEMVVTDLERERTRPLEERGAKFAPTVAAVAESSDVVMSMLPTSEAVRAVALGEHGLCRGANGARTWIDFSSVDRETLLNCAAKLAGSGWSVLDCSVNGVEEIAIAGELAIWVSGDVDLFDRYRSLFAPMGRVAVHVGAQGNAKLVKNAMAMYAAVSQFAMVEIITWLSRNGISDDQFRTVVENSALFSPALERLLETVVSREFKPRKSWMPKDIGFGLANARQLEHPMPMVSLAGQLFAVAQATGLDGFEATGIACLVYNRMTSRD